jgi:hypothetical protein
VLVDAIAGLKSTRQQSDDTGRRAQSTDLTSILLYMAVSQLAAIFPQTDVPLSVNVRADVTHISSLVDDADCIIQAKGRCVARTKRSLLISRDFAERGNACSTVAATVEGYYAQIK